MLLLIVISARNLTLIGFAEKAGLLNINKQVAINRLMKLGVDRYSLFKVVSPDKRNKLFETNLLRVHYYKMKLNPN